MVSGSLVPIVSTLSRSLPCFVHVWSFPLRSGYINQRNGPGTVNGQRGALFLSLKLRMIMSAWAVFRLVYVD